MESIIMINELIKSLSYSEIIQTLILCLCFGCFVTRISREYFLIKKVDDLRAKIRRMEIQEITRIRANDIKSHIFPLYFENLSDKLPSKDNEGGI